MSIDRRSAATLILACTAIGAGTLACGVANPEGRASSSLRVGVAAPVLLTSTGSVALRFHRNALTRETLVALGEDGRPVPRLIESWQASADGLMWRLRLRQGVSFHEGTPLTAPEIAPAVSRALLAAGLGAIRDVTSENSHDLIVRLNEPYAFMFEDLAVISAQRTVGDQSYDTGPYVVREESADRLLLHAVEDHYRGRPEVDRVEVQLFPDQRNAWSALMRDQVDMLYEVNRDSLEFVRGESSVRVATFPRPYVYLLGLNLKRGALADARVRRALDLAVDREKFVREAMASEGEPAQGHVWPGHWTFDSEASAIETDRTRSLRLLDEAGLKVRHTDGRMPSRLRLHCLVYEPLKQMGMVLQRQLAEIDVDLDLEVVPTGQFLERITNGNFEAFVFEMASARGMKWPYQFWHSGTPFVRHGYSGADTILDAMRRAPNDDAFRLAALAFQRRVHEDPPAIFLAWGRTSRAVSTRFEIPGGDEDIYHTIARWKLAAKPGI